MFPDLQLYLPPLVLGKMQCIVCDDHSSLSQTGDFFLLEIKPHTVSMCTEGEKDEDQ